MPRTLIVAAVVAALLALGWSGRAVRAQVPEGATAATVIRVIDGDTVRVRFDDGAEATVRYLGIATPETVIENRPAACYGPEATERNRQLVGDAVVYLEPDRSEADGSGRLLRYVYLEDGTFVNETLVLEGYARAAPSLPDVREAARIRAAEQVAQAQRAGLWRACTGAVDPPPPVPGRTTPSGSDCPEAYPIKANRETGVYVVPGQEAYDRTVPAECFASELDARAAGYQRALP